MQRRHSAPAPSELVQDAYPALWAFHLGAEECALKASKLLPSISSSAAPTHPDASLQVWIVQWLYTDHGEPYLAEVFEKGEVSEGRLPHLHRFAIPRGRG